MVKHNNVIPNQHFHKDWARYVKTWFNQPAQKKIRREKRILKAKTVAPRPLHLLRPVIRCPTVKYNTKIRSGRGFTLDELKAAGISKKDALNVGIAVDHRRKNKSNEAFQNNVQRLKTYQAKLVIFPKRGLRHPKNGDSSRDELNVATQLTTKEIVPISFPVPSVKARTLTSEELKVDPKDPHPTWSILRSNRLHERLWGKREKRAKEKIEKEKAAAATKAKKAAKGK